MIGASAQEGLMWARTASSMLMSSEGGSSTGCVFGAVSGTRRFTQPTIWSGVRPVGGCGQESIDWTNLPDNGAAMRLEYQILVAIALDLVLGDPRWFPHPSFAGRLASANHRCAGLFLARARGVATAAHNPDNGSGDCRTGLWCGPPARLRSIVSVLLLYTTLPQGPG